MRHLITTLFLSFFIMSQNACSEDRVVVHSFEYNLTRDSPGVDLLAYQYGNSKGPFTREEVAPGETRLIGSGGSAGPMLIADFLYVKWRDKATQKVFEDRVDLSGLATKDVHGSKIYFLIDDNRLYVYLIPERDWEGKRHRLPPGKAPNGPPGYEYLDVVTLYPEQAPPKVRGGVL